jgi:hypothetical protein
MFWFSLLINILSYQGCVLDRSLVIRNLTSRFQKEEKPRPKSFIERLAEERDAKRRKMSKKVHTNRKSHTEVCVNFVCYWLWHSGSVHGTGWSTDWLTDWTRGLKWVNGGSLKWKRAMSSHLKSLPAHHSCPSLHLVLLCIIVTDEPALNNLKTRLVAKVLTLHLIRHCIIFTVEQHCSIWEMISLGSIILHSVFFTVGAVLNTLGIDESWKYYCKYMKIKESIWI